MQHLESGVDALRGRIAHIDKTVASLRSQLGNPSQPIGAVHRKLNQVRSAQFIGRADWFNVEPEVGEEPAKGLYDQTPYPSSPRAYKAGTEKPKPLRGDLNWLYLKPKQT